MPNKQILFENIQVLQDQICELGPFVQPMLTNVKDYYRIATAWSSTVIEGYSYTESETKILLEEGLTIGGKPLSHALAVVGHDKAYQAMFELLKSDSLEEDNILLFHSLLGDIKQGSFGKYRDINVMVSGSKYPLAKFNEIPKLMHEFFQWVTTNKNMHPLELAALAHQKFVYIHPFADGNGRVARLLMNTLLIQRGFLPLCVPPIKRHEYFLALENGRDKPNNFICLIADLYKEQAKDFLRCMNMDDTKNIELLF